MLWLLNDFDSDAVHREHCGMGLTAEAGAATLADLRANAERRMGCATGGREYVVYADWFMGLHVLAIVFFLGLARNRNWT